MVYRWANIISGQKHFKQSKKTSSSIAMSENLNEIVVLTISRLIITVSHLLYIFQ